MEVLNISQDSNESDTSGDELFDKDDVEVVGSLNSLAEESGYPYIDVFQSWKRPSPSRPLSSQPKPGEDHKFKFYLMDCDSWASGEVNPLIASSIQPKLQMSAIKPVMRLFGVNEAGSSVTCFVHGFSPYFYAMPSNIFTPADLPSFSESLNLAILREMENDLSCIPFLEHVDQEHPPVFNVEILENPSALNIFGFHEAKNCGMGGEKRASLSADVILKVSCLITKFVWLAAKVLNAGLVSCPFIDDPCSYRLFEETLNPSLRFLTSLNISCCTWLDFELTPGKWYDRDSLLDPVLQRQSYSEVEFDIDYKDIKMSPNAECQKSVPSPMLRILSFDIECMTRPPKYEMPKDGNDRVLQIGNVLSTYTGSGSSDPQPLKVIFTLGSCDPVPDATVLSFDDEQSLLESWRQFVIATDPDILTGYNIVKFDIPFLIERARKLHVKIFPYFSRIITSPASVRPVANKDKRICNIFDRIVSVPGRVVLDMFPVMKQNFPNEQSYKLAHISKIFLEFEEKGDVKYTDIFRLQNMSPKTRNTLAKYCLQDAWIVSQLVHQNPRATLPSGDYISYYCEKSSSSGSPLRYLLSKSSDYNAYFKMVRKQKNPEREFAAVTPASRKREQPEDIRRRDKVRRTLFPGSEVPKPEPETEQN